MNSPTRDTMKQDLAAPGEQQADSHPLVQQMYRQVQERVASNTRFQPDALQLTTASVKRQAIGINAVYTLTAGVNTRHITGRFQPAAQDQAHAAPEQAVRAALPALLQQAAHAAQDLLRQPQARYTAVNGKTRLGKSVRYWSMGTCATCHGSKSMTCVHCNNGKTECTVCDSLGKQRCPQCDGACTVGCMQCGTLGTLTTTEPVSVNYTVYVNGQSQTEYRTEYHNIQRPCPSCNQSGRSSCPTCGQSGRVRCRSCGGDHYLRCRYCDGNGAVSCQSCQGSGQTGTLAESMVTVDCQCKADIPANSDPLLPAIQQALSMDTLLAQLDAQSLQALDGSIQGNSARLNARFTGQLEIVRLGVHCAGQNFSLSAFGKQTEWLEQDRLIERLLTADLAMLEKALLDADRQPLFKPDLLPVQQALGNALQARLHEQLALDSADAASGAATVSAAFAERIQARSQTAARWLAKAMARKLWPWAAGSSLLLGGAAAIAGGMAAALLASVLAAGTSVLAYRLLTLRLFKSVYPSTEAAHSAWQLLWKQKQLLGPISALTAPAVLLAVAAVIWLPGMTLPGITAAPDAASATANGLEQAVQAWKQGDLSKARSQAGNLARQGDTSAFGFYAWLIAAGVGAEAGDPTAHDYAAAQHWIDRAYAANPGDLWAKTANATLLLEGLGRPRDSKKGTALLHSAAEGGLVPAMYMAGQYALRGKHVSQQNIMLARKWFSQAAAQHDADALYTLGTLDWHGVGLSKPDHSKAMQSWQESAALGNKAAAQAVQTGRPAQ